jgi:hypothetical protein
MAPGAGAFRSPVVSAPETWNFELLNIELS